MPRLAAPYTCDVVDPLRIDRVAPTCPLVVYEPDGSALVPARVVAVRGGANVEVASAPVLGGEARDVHHTAYCGLTTIVAERTDHEAFATYTFTPAGLVDGEALLVLDADDQVVANLTVDASAPCAEPLREAWCGSSWPGDCPADDPPAGADDHGCAASGGANALVGALVVTLVCARRRAC